MLGAAPLSPLSAQTRVEVDEQSQTIELRRLVLAANAISQLPIALEDLRPGDVVQLGLTSTRSSASFVVDLLPSNAVQAFMAERTRLFSGRIDRDRAAPAPILLQWAIPDAGSYGLVISDYGLWAGQADVVLDARVRRTLTAAERSARVVQFQSLASFVDERFITRPFRLLSRPCNQINASSDPNTGDILLCSEILPRLLASDGVRLGVFFHELGHSLLRIWALPGWDRETAADDFAIYMLLQLPGGPGLAADFGSFFQSDDPVAEALLLAQQGGVHPLGLQRIQNIQARLRDPDGFMDEWNRLIYPRMQSAHLRRIATDPRPYESSPLAQAVLSQRR